MKRLLTAFFIVISVSVFAQQDILITLEGDTLEGKVSFFRKSYYDQVELKNEEGKEVYKSYQITSARKDDISYFPIVYNNRRVIGKLISKGALSHYMVMSEDVNGFGTEILVKEDDTHLVVSNIGFRKRLLEFINDCQVLIDKLESKEMSASDLSNVISIYNNSCANGEGSTPILEDIPEIEESSDLQEFAQLIIDIQKKIDAGEKVPSYLIEALKEVEPSSIQEDIKKLIKKLESK